MSERGYLIFANNNPEVDYGLIALCNALMIKSNSEVKDVTLVTDNFTLDWLRSSRGNLVDRAFNRVIVQNWEEVTKGSTQRRMQDTPSTTKSLAWYNGTRRNAYDLSPYQETILLDCDYLVCDRSLDLCWGSVNEVMINRQARTLEHQDPSPAEQMLGPFSIPMLWATCVYFQKGKKAKLLFDLVGHVRENYPYYQYVYGFGGRLYRNDFAFSIAAHMLDGFQKRHDTIPTLPYPVLTSSFDCDELYDVPAKNELVFLVNDTSDKWRFRLSRTKGINVHVMNKFSIVRHADKIIDIYGAQNG